MKKINFDFKATWEKFLNLFKGPSKEEIAQYKEAKKVSKEAKKLAKPRFNSLISEIKEENKRFESYEQFDIKGLKNVIHNIKVTGNFDFYNHFIEEKCNETGLYQSLEAVFLKKTKIKSDFITGLGLLELDIQDEKSKFGLIKTYIDFSKKYNKGIIRFIEIDKKKISIKEKLSKVFAILKGTLDDSKSALIKELDLVNEEYEQFLNSYQFNINLVNEFKVELEALIKDLSSVNKIYWLNLQKTKTYKDLGNFFLKFYRKTRPIITKDNVRFYELFTRKNFNKFTLKTYFFGNEEKRGVLVTIIIYALLILFGFVYLYPMLYILAYSFMGSSDLVNPNVNYVPTYLETQNYVDAFTVMNYWETLGESLLVSVVPAICQTICCSLVAYGLARYDFNGKKIVFGLIIFTFLIPSCLTMLPTINLYAQLHITGNVLSYVLPSLFGQGLKSAVFILIFYQYFKGIPKAITEAAEIDGANTFVVYLKIALPSAKSGILLSILLSIVWYYNETVLASAFFGSEISTLPLALQSFKSAFDSIYGNASVETGKSINEAIYMAGTMLNILPLLILYFFTQKYFVQGVDKAGITGE